MPHQCINQERICQLERDSTKMTTKIENLVTSLDNLTGWLKSLVMILVSSIMGTLGWLIVQVFNK